MWDFLCPLIGSSVAETSRKGGKTKIEWPEKRVKINAEMKPKKLPINKSSATAKCERAVHTKQLSKTSQTAKRETSNANQRPTIDGGRNSTQIIYTCSGCNKPIRRDKFLLKACDKYWHENCLKCDRCHSRLGELGSTLYHKADMILCRQDYLE